MHRSRVVALSLVSSVVLAAACSASDDTPNVDPDTDAGQSSGGSSGASSSGASGGAITSSSSSGEVDSGPPGPTHDDGIKNGDETDVDCGGATAPACAPGLQCIEAPDCRSEVCSDGVCAAPTHDDGVKNGDETGVDCGGATAPRCAPGLGCQAATDCAEKVCTGGVCAAPRYDDGVQNGDETGIDCGGGAPSRCAPGQGCDDRDDCMEDVCIDLVCAAATATDGVKNGDETDIDCGGSSGRTCEVGAMCLVGADCTQKVCGGNGTCSAPTFTDGVQNGTETGVDCGGPAATAAQRCATGQGCVNGQGARDCVSLVCSNAICQAPSFNDGVQNGTETGVDCGGPDAPNRCGVGQGCAAGSDCVEKVCGPANNRVCLAPTFADGVQNGTETDVDCGGPAATATQRCAAGKLCGGDGDCSSDGCAYNGRCAVARSCAPRFGGDTCGAGEVGAPGSVHESCCTSIAVPGQNVRLDKYEITSGRIREFLRRVPNVRTWVNNNAVPQLSSFGGVDLRGYLSDDVNDVHHPRRHVSPHIYLPEQPSSSQGCWLGQPGSGGYGGHNTYWFSAADQAALGGAAGRSFTQEQLDVKPITCTTYVLLAAFCAWDGGFLPTRDQVRAAWSTTYPWGDSPDYQNTVGANGQPMANWNNGLGNAFQAKYKFPITNAGFDYGQYDQAFVIAAPGRMVNDASPLGWRDLAANTFEMVATSSGSYSGNGYNGIPRNYWMGGSFEGHHQNRDGSGYQYPVLTKYGKTGGRCARPL